MSIVPKLIAVYTQGSIYMEHPCIRTCSWAHVTHNLIKDIQRYTIVDFQYLVEVLYIRQKIFFFIIELLIF